MLGLSLALTPLSLAQTAAPAPEPAPAAAEAPTPEEIKKVASYLMGFQFAQQLSGESASLKASDFDPAIFQQGFAAGFEGKFDPEIEAKIPTHMQAFVDNLKKLDDAQGTANAEAGKKFLEENAKKPGVLTLPSGLQYKVITEGKGAKYDSAKDGQSAICKVMYEGRHIDGTVFDASKEPIEFGINQVVPGFSEALKLMPAGSTWEVYIPSELGYGESGSGRIGKNATLIFKLELIGISPGAGKPGGQPIDLTPEMIEALRSQGMQAM